MTSTKGFGCRPTCRTDIIRDVSDSARFEEMQTSLSTIGVSGEGQSLIFEALAGIAFLGNIEFSVDDDDDDKLQLVQLDDFKRAAELLRISPDALQRRLTTRTVKVRRENY